MLMKLVGNSSVNYIGRLLMVIGLMLLMCLTINAQSAKQPLYQQLSQLLAKQPDYQADREIEGYGLKLLFRYAQKMDMARQEYIMADDYKMIAIIDLGKKTFMVLDPQQKTYFAETIVEFEHFGETAQVLPFPIMILDSFVQGNKIHLLTNDSKIRLASKQSISGYAVNVFTIESDGINYKLYFANKLSNLLVRIDSHHDAENFNYSDTLSNVELTVPRQLFVIPADYQQVDQERLFSAIPIEVLKKEGKRRQEAFSKMKE